MNSKSLILKASIFNRYFEFWASKSNKSEIRNRRCVGRLIVRFFCVLPPILGIFEHFFELDDLSCHDDSETCEEIDQ